MKMMEGVHTLSSEGRDLAPQVLGEDGHPKIMPAEFYASTTQNERSLFCVRHGLYGLPTTQLIAWLKAEIATESAIEIGAGNGVLAKALGIIATDSRQQERPEVREHCRLIRQTPVRYGANVEKRDALSAARKYLPRDILACWVTHKYNPAEAFREGNADGIDELELLSLCERYIFIGNQGVHRLKPLWSRKPERYYEFPWLYSRAMNGSPNFIAIWRGTR